MLSHPLLISPVVPTTLACLVRQHVGLDSYAPRGHHKHHQTRSPRRTQSMVGLTACTLVCWLLIMRPYKAVLVSHHGTFAYEMSDLAGYVVMAWLPSSRLSYLMARPRCCR
jgi:hypothetical protein